MKKINAEQVLERGGPGLWREPTAPLALSHYFPSRKWAGNEAESGVLWQPEASLPSHPGLRGGL